MNFNNILHKASEYIWGNGLIFLLLLTGLLYTIRSHFVQFRFIPFLIRSRNITHSDDKDDKGISQMKTVCLSLGTAMGTGNITGVASALAIGGAGAVFWMWVSAFLGMALVYGENFLSAKYSRADGLKGPMAYKVKHTDYWNGLYFCIFMRFRFFGNGRYGSGQLFLRQSLLLR